MHKKRRLLYFIYSFLLQIADPEEPMEQTSIALQESGSFDSGTGSSSSLSLGRSLPSGFGIDGAGPRIIPTVIPDPSQPPQTLPSDNPSVPATVMSFDTTPNNTKEMHVSSPHEENRNVAVMEQ